MRKHYQILVREADIRVDRALSIQFLEDPDSPFHGGFRDRNGLIEAKFAIYQIADMLSCYVNPDSRWYLRADLMEKIRYGVGFAERTQRPNGFFDFNDCNFYSAPDTAFCLKKIFPVYFYLKNIASDLSGCEEMIVRLEQILRKGADAICIGGFHTPNHRWAIASILSVLAVLFDRPDYREVADRYLAEGIDCNEDGEYAERSAGNYNRVNNDAMILLAVFRKDDSFFEPVIRNLKMMLTYIEPDGSVFTNNSTRQDRGVKTYPEGYYFEYLYMGNRFQIPEFLDAANALFDQCTARASMHADNLIYYMVCPELIDFEYDRSGIPSVYRRFYEDSNIIRARNGRYSYSIINNCPDFLYFQSGALTCGFRIGASFCEHRAFVPKELGAFREDGSPLSPHETAEESGKITFRLHEKKVGWYYLPFKEPPVTSDWWKMDTSKREKILGPDMIFDVSVDTVPDGIDLTIRTTGIDKAPLRLEISLDAGCTVETEHFMTEGIPGGGIVVKSGTLSASKGPDRIEIGPCFGEHHFTAGKFGSAGRNVSCFTVYLTDFTCFEHTLKIRSACSRY